MKKLMIGAMAALLPLLAGRAGRAVRDRLGGLWP